MRVYVILDKRSSATNPLGDAIETFIRREHAMRQLRGVQRTACDCLPMAVVLPGDLAALVDRNCGAVFVAGKAPQVGLRAI